MNPSLTPNVGNFLSIFPRIMPAVILQLCSLSLGEQMLNIRSGIYAGFSKSFQDDPYNIEWNLEDGYHS